MPTAGPFQPCDGESRGGARYRRDVRLLLIRHGQTPSNVAGELDTAVPGAGLTDLGRLQAAALPGALAHEQVGSLHVSPLRRTQETAAPVAAQLGLTPTVHPGLAEIGAGDLEMRADDASRAAYAECVAAWITGDLDRAMPGGHDAHPFLERYDAAVAAAVTGRGPHDTVVVVSHGAAIRAWTSLRARDVTGEEGVRLGIANTGAATLEGSPGDWQLVAWHGDPLGGAHLADDSALDVTGEASADR